MSLLVLAAKPAEAPKKMAEPKRVLMVVSAATELALADGSKMAVGYWANEVEVPLARLRAAGYAVDIVTPGGRTPVPDPASLSGDPVKAQATRDAHAKIEGLVKPGSLEAIDRKAMDKYAAVVIPGGYAPMVDLSASPAMREVLYGAMMNNKIVAAICHGPAAFLSTKRPPAPWAFKGYKMAPFSNDEEAAWLKERRLAWQLEDALFNAGAVIETAGPWQKKVVRDRNVITAQSSPSVDAFTDAILAALAEPPGK